MIELRGKLTVQRIGGVINLIPTAGSPPLQGKVVFPSHDEQLIKPDEDYYGLSVVTVVATPRIPCAEASAQYDGETIINPVVDCLIDLGIEDTPTDIDPFYHNRAQFPDIPEEVKTHHPYRVIVHYGDTVYLYASIDRFYIHVGDDYTYLRSQPNIGNVRYTLNTELNQWVLSGSTFNYWSLALNDIWNEHYTLWWSNHDIYNLSSEDNEIYFPSSEPTVELPTVEPTHYYYNGLKLPKLPDVASPETYPYRTIFQKADGTIQLYAFVRDVYFTATSTFNPANIQWNGGSAYAKYDPTTDAWIDVSTSTYGSIFNIGADYRTALWAEKDIPRGSATATSIAYYGSPCVPEPM